MRLWPETSYLSSINANQEGEYFMSKGFLKKKIRPLEALFN
jgi:hypothetical protein